MAQSPLNGTTQPVDIEEEGWSPTMDRQWLKKPTYALFIYQGLVGFKNAKKKTNVAAQAVGVAVGQVCYKVDIVQWILPVCKK